MSVVLTNIVKGLARRFDGKVQRPKNQLSWWQVKLLKHQEDQNIKQIRVNNLRIHYKRPYEFLHSYTDIFKNEVYKFFAPNPKPLIIDCGSNIGLSILYFKYHYPDATIIGFEPDPANFELLARNISENKCKDVKIMPTAVWTTNGITSFIANSSEASRLTFLEKQVKAISVNTVRLSEFLQSYNSIDFLKIDIEGAEYDVLMDCASLLERVSNIFLEYHGKASETQKLYEILEILNANRFDVYIRNAADVLLHPFTEKKSPGNYEVQLNLFCYRNDRS